MGYVYIVIFYEML